ncbi:DUF4245 domain-containing protein [Arsenicicoccus piscis]|uniref:DUF4245 domain-containing protein n=1 Tax=Arsenicicoccus piscis TaxID=673954 RepID=A0ABQ6HJX1_9MICO|nr:DUF4245 domain-containing protein [Arsenicicoccus piscis]MCH8627841.1 DUF4245 domain-containing protein [Arsenicicoccus piscis]GMA18363.1 hypothetical protein GCM10025862_03840 [Arsenicicoccus piscis]
MSSTVVPDPPKRRRGMGNLQSMVLSMLVLVGATLFFVMMVARPSEVPRRSLDAGSVATQVQSQAGWSPSQRTPLPAGWTVNVARYETQAKVPTWQVGYLAANTYYAVRQAKAGTAEWVDNAVDGAQAAGTQTVGGVVYDVFADDKGNRSLVHRGTGTTPWTVVSSNAPADQLAAFVASLTPPVR